MPYITWICQKQGTVNKKFNRKQNRFGVRVSGGQQQHAQPFQSWAGNFS